VHVYFGGPAGDATAVGVPMHADLQRDDLCEPLGTCNHGFEMEVPLSLQDGAVHPVHVYAIDSAGAANAELASSPQQLQCPRPEIPDGVRRLASADTIAAWGFSTFWRMAMVEQTQLDELEQGTELGSTPLLVRTEGAPEIWWVDAGWRRHVSDPEVAAAWGLDLASAQVVSDAILDQWREGTPMRDAPTLVSVDGLTVYLVDDAQMSDGSADDGGDDSGSAGDDGGGADDSGDGDMGTDDDGGGAALPGGEGGDAGCGCTAAPTRHGVLALGLLLLGVRRRRD
jgi:MYXO-CTERM domain-containing protein